MPVSCQPFTAVVVAAPASITFMFKRAMASADRIGTTARVNAAQDLVFVRLAFWISR